MATELPTLLTASEFQPLIKAKNLAATYDAMRKLQKPVKVQIGRKVYVHAEAWAKYVAGGGDQ